MGRIQVHIRDEHLWQSKDGVHCRGTAFRKNASDAPVPMHAFVAAATSFEGFSERARELNGFFAVIRELGDEVHIVVDHMRSIPVFYGEKDGQWYVSDDAHWVRREVGDTSCDPLAEAEFERAGYVTGSDTLYPHVKQVQAAEVLAIRPSGVDPKIDRSLHYLFKYEKPFDVSFEELIEMHEAVLTRAIERMIRWANGRCLCIPLSGGLDSRLISVMLKRLKYDNVCAFTYGQPGNYQWRISEQVARNLGMKLHLIPYDNESWRRWFHSEERKAYYRLADGLVSLPHIQDWPAVWELKRNGLLPADAAFVPGHSGNCPTGDHIRQECAEPGERPGQDLFCRTILKYHYRLAKSDPNGELVARLRERILSRLPPGYGFASLEEVSNAHEQWEWQERQAKFVVNSVRVYDFWGYGWWMPLWDVDYLDFWSKVPFRLRVGQVLYRTHVARLYGATSGIDEETARKVALTFARPLREFVKRTPIHRFARWMWSQYSKRTEYDTHHFAWYGIMPRDQFIRLYWDQGGINRLLIMEYLGRVSYGVQ